MSTPTTRSEYRVPRPEGPIDLWLDGNEGPAPTGPTLTALGGIDAEILRRYPDARGLEGDLADGLSVLPEQVVVTAGADEALDRFCRAFLERGSSIVVLTPAFEMLTRYAELAGAEIREVPWVGSDFPSQGVVDAIDQTTRAIAFATPNNPTGLVVEPAAIEQLAQAAPAVHLLVDLVYADFLEVDPTRELLRLPNVVVTRSFSKGAGLAGLRVGYAVGPCAVINAMRRVAGPYPVSGPSLAIARAALRQPADLLAPYFARVRCERDELRTLLVDGGAEVPRSAANFVLATLPRARWLFHGLASLGIAVRSFVGRPGLDESVRITCPGDGAAFARLVHAVATTLAPQALLFDLDGVLADVSASYREAIVRTAAEFGVTLSLRDISAAKASGDANSDWRLTRQLLRERGHDVPLPDVTARFEHIYQGSGERDGLWRDETLRVPRAWLADLAQRYPLALVTGRPRHDADRFLQTHGIADCFRAVVCMEDAAAKPSPEPVTRALLELGCERAWLLGDTVDDVRAARAAGVVSIGVVAPGEPPDTTATTLHAAGAARVLKTPEELGGLLP